MSPVVSGGGGGGAISGVTVSGTAASGQVPVASSSSAGAWGYPPGFLINYTQITTPANVTDTSESTATALISPGAITFDGTAVWAEFGGILLAPTVASNAITITLFEGATQITRLAFWDNPAAATAGSSVTARYKFTPTAASHTYTVCGFVGSTTGTPRILCGTGGTGGYPPAYIAFYKA